MQRKEQIAPKVVICGCVYERSEMSTSLGESCNRHRIFCEQHNDALSQFGREAEYRCVLRYVRLS